MTDPQKTTTESSSNPEPVNINQLLRALRGAPTKDETEHTLLIATMTGARMPDIGNITDTTLEGTNVTLKLSSKNSEGNHR